MACGGLLPVVAIEPANAKYDPRDFLLRRAIAIAVDALKHSSQSRALLFCQPRVGRDSPAVKCRKQTIDRLKSVEPLDAEGDECADGRIGRQSAGSHQLDGLPTAEIMPEKSLCTVANGNSAIERWAPVSACSENCGLFGEYDGAGIVLREPEDLGCRRRIQRIHREIATPTAAGSRRSADVHHSWRSSARGNPCRRTRCVEAIPTRDQMRSGLRHVCSCCANASRTHPVSSRFSLSP